MNLGHAFAALTVVEGIAGMYALWRASRAGEEVTTPPTETATMTLPTDHEGLV